MTGGVGELRSLRASLRPQLDDEGNELDSVVGHLADVIVGEVGTRGTVREQH